MSGTGWIRTDGEFPNDDSVIKYHWLDIEAGKGYTLYVYDIEIEPVSETLTERILKRTRDIKLGMWFNRAMKGIE